jgi:hypothetical protein
MYRPVSVRRVTVVTRLVKVSRPQQIGRSTVWLSGILISSTWQRVFGRPGAFRSGALDRTAGRDGAPGVDERVAVLDLVGAPKRCEPVCSVCHAPRNGDVTPA